MGFKEIIKNLSEQTNKTRRLLTKKALVDKIAKSYQEKATNVFSLVNNINFPRRKFHAACIANKLTFFPPQNSPSIHFDGGLNKTCYYSNDYPIFAEFKDHFFKRARDIRKYKYMQPYLEYFDMVINIFEDNEENLKNVWAYYVLFKKNRELNEDFLRNTENLYNLFTDAQDDIFENISIDDDVVVNVSPKKYLKVHVKDIQGDDLITNNGEFNVNEISTARTLLLACPTLIDFYDTLGDYSYKHTSWLGLYYGDEINWVKKNT